MSSGPLLVFDFDGVLVDGMDEYWWSARRAALRLASANSTSADQGSGAADQRPPLKLPTVAPPGFSLLRPLIHKGWEMVLMAAELARPDFDLGATIADYDRCLAVALDRWGWRRDELQLALERVRSEAIATDRSAWLALHRFYPGVPERLGRLAAEGADWAVLTTKGAAFAGELLAATGLAPWALYGHEQGSKAEVLLRLLEAPASAGRSLWFIEDRRPTLELVRRTPGLEAVRCYLVAWGYLALGDERDLESSGIRWLPDDCFNAPLARWP